MVQHSNRGKTEKENSWERVFKKEKNDVMVRYC